jgi:hypothetical protein
VVSRQTFQPLVVQLSGGGIVVAMGAVDAISGRLAVFAQRVNQDMDATSWGAANPLVGVLSAGSYQGFELPYRNPIARVGRDVIFVLVAVAPGAAGRSVMYYRVDGENAGVNGNQYDVAPTAPRTARGPALAALEPDRCLGAFADWDGNLDGGLGTIWYLQGTIEGDPGDDLNDAFSAFEESAVPTIVADPAENPVNSRFLIERVRLMAGNPRLLLKRENAELSLPPGWPDEGLDFMPEGHILAGDLGTPPPPLPVPDHRGAIVGWTNRSDGEYAAYIGRVNGEQ